MTRSIYIITCIVVLFVAARLDASVPFGSEQTITGRNGANNVLTGDLDGDLVADVVGLGGGTLVYALNGGDGTSWSASNLVNSSRPRQIALADLDGDTDLDVVHTDFKDGRVYRILNDLDTTGTFLARQTIGSAGGADGVFAADIDNDTDLDLVVTGRSADAYYWFENVNGSGTSWTRHTIATGLDAPQIVWVTDLDGDTDLDIVGGGAEDNGQLVWFENTAGDGSAWALTAIHSAWINSIAVDDIDHDGDPDIVVQENNAGPSTADIFVWWENTSGDASTWVEQSIGPAGRDASRGLQLVDLDQDGDLDVVGDRNGDWYENLFGDASAWMEHSYSTADEIHDTDVRDMDGDGDLDIVGARLERDRLVWWENLTCSLADPDDDSDGVRDDCDVCDGFDDALDDDGDGVPNGCDACPGEDDRVDLDDEGTPDACQGMIAIDDVGQVEGDSGITTFSFNVTLTGDVSGGFTVPFATVDGTATTADSDYAAASDTLAFAGTDGETQVVSIDVQGDGIVEDDETFTVVLGAPSISRVTASDDTGLGTIQNDDSAMIAIDDVDQVEGDSGTTTFNFTVTLTGDVDGGFTVPFSTADGTATTADADYIAAADSLSFTGTDGETQTITVDVQGDGTVEDDETFTVVLGAPSNSSVTASDGTGLGTLRNDDSATLSIGDVSVAEGDSGNTSFTFTVTLTGGVAPGFSVSFATADGTATIADADYIATSDSLSFVGTDGETQFVTVFVQGDTANEEDENFFVNLTSTTHPNVTILDGTGEGLISDDDVLLSITIEGLGHIGSIPAGIDCGNEGTDCDEIYPLGTGVELLATAALGWSLSGWSGNADCSDSFVNLDVDTNCTAIFEVHLFADGFESGDTFAWSDQP